MYALVDVNSMYCSCETVFRPDLQNRPVIVLSNNDGAIVARNKLAKKIGLKMGEAYFKSKPLLDKYNVAVFSSNYTLYNSFSDRFASVVESLSANVERYSIDELFVACENMEKVMSYEVFGQQLRDEVFRHTGLTVGVGVAKTKTLAKVCNHHAKTWGAFKGVLAVTEPDRLRRMLQMTDIGDVWGVGRRLSEKLNFMGFKTAYDLSQADTRMIRKSFNVVLERTVRELRGEPCFALEENPPAKQQIVVSRSFGERITNLEEMQRAVCGFAVRAGEKIRHEQQHAKVISVFIKSSPFAVKEISYGNVSTVKLLTPTQDTRDIVNAAQHALGAIWREGVRYAKAGVMLSDFNGREAQLNLFDDSPPRPKSDELMHILDTINQSGRSKLFFAGEGINNDFHMRRDMLSPAYTTRWNELPKVLIK